MASQHRYKGFKDLAINIERSILPDYDETVVEDVSSIPIDGTAHDRNIPNQSCWEDPTDKEKVVKDVSSIATDRTAHDGDIPGDLEDDWEDLADMESSDEPWSDEPKVGRLL